MKKKLEVVATKMIKEAIANTSHGNWCFYFDELEDVFGVEPTFDNLNELTAVISQREEVLAVDLEQDCISLYLGSDYYKGSDY